MLLGWLRKEHFDHYLQQIPCTYSAVFKLDVSSLRAKKAKFFPTVLHCLSSVVNQHPEFRMSFESSGKLGYFEVAHPCFTIFHKDTETFSNLWTEYSPDLTTFCETYEANLNRYGNCHKMEARPDTPENTFPVSCLPWASFGSFQLNFPKSYSYLLPIFTLGKFYDENGKTLLPLAIQVHHAVCDGFHLCRFVNELQNLFNDAK